MRTRALSASSTISPSSYFSFDSNHFKVVLIFAFAFPDLCRKIAVLASLSGHAYSVESGDISVQRVSIHASSNFILGSVLIDVGVNQIASHGAPDGRKLHGFCLSPNLPSKVPSKEVSALAATSC